MGIPRIGQNKAIDSGKSEYCNVLLTSLSTQAYWQRLYKFVRRHSLADEDAQDIVQQAFLQALQCASQFNGHSSIGTWLHGIAKNLVRHHLTRTPQQRYEFVGDSALLDLYAGDEDCPLWRLEIAEQLKLLDSSWKKLPAKTQRLLELVALDEVSYESAAEQMSIPIGTVRSRVSRARSQIRSKAAL